MIFAIGDFLLVAGPVSPPPGTSRADRRILGELSPAQQRAEIQKLRKQYDFFESAKWAHYQPLGSQLRGTAKAFEDLGKPSK